MLNRNRYRLREDAIRDEAGSAHTVYGVEWLDDDGRAVECYPDVFWDREKAVAFVAWCNAEDVELILLPDLVADAIQEQYMV